METFSTEQGAMTQAKDLRDSSHLWDDGLKQLSEMNPTYPGWGSDFENAFDSYEAGDGDQFMASCRMLEEKQHAFQNFKSYNRLKALVALVLTYPGSEQDLQSAEEWNIKNVSNQENDRIFQGKLDDMKNKETLYIGDSIHPHIAAADKLEITYPGYQCALSSAHLNALVTLVLTYPGNEEDLQIAEEWTIKNVPNQENDIIFQDMLDSLKYKEALHVGDDTNHPGLEGALSSTHLNAVVALVLTYPGSEQDLQSAEEWTIKNVSNEENDRIFQDKLDGMRNKETLHVGDRTHPHIVAVDKLEITYPRWEEDYQCAVSAHCEAPSARFPDAFHALRERQQVFSGDRSHWRLVQLDSLKLSYPGWEEDVKEVEEWHLQNAVNDTNNGMFNEVLEGMKDQQMICMGWDHDSMDSASIGRSSTDLDTSLALSESNSVLESPSSCSSKSTASAQEGSFSKLEKEADPAKTVEEACYQGCYRSISESLKTHEKKKKKLVKERSQSRPAVPGPEARSATPSRSSRVLGSKSWFAPRPAPRQVAHDSNDNEGSDDKRANLGKCVVCLNRASTHVFVPCGHLCACAPCGSRAMKTTGACPICRGIAAQTFRVFLT